MAEKPFLLGSRIGAKADLGSRSFLFPLAHFLMHHAGNNVFGTGTAIQRAKACWVPFATVSYSQRL